MRYSGKRFIQIKFDGLERLAPHNRQRICWIGSEGKSYEELCESSSPYRNQPSNKAINVHIKYDLKNKRIKIKD